MVIFFGLSLVAEHLSKDVQYSLKLLVINSVPITLLRLAIS